MLTVHRVLPHYGDVRVVLADGTEQRHYFGVPAAGDGGRYLFVEIDRVTLLEIERGEVSLYTILAERAIGQVFESNDVVFAEDVVAQPAEAPG